MLPVQLLIYSFNFCVYTSAHHRKVFLICSAPDVGLGLGVCKRGHVGHTPQVLGTYTGLSTVLVAIACHVSGNALAKSLTFNTVRNDTSRKRLA